ncbi:MAG: alanine racemase [Desulfamplus sp.]|nr:alanine racemase [Desulfamplus sp.]
MNSAKGSLMPVSRLFVDLNALAGNLKALKARCSQDVLFMAVVKANAYGHGAVPVAKTALANGASFLAVARIHEALELREAGISSPLLLFGDVDPTQAEWLSSQDVRVSIGSLDVAREIAGAAISCGHTLKAHIKVDTGMGRLGVVMPDGSGSADESGGAIDEITRIISLKGIHVEGIYTHFANADVTDKSHARYQVERFNRLLNALEQRGIKPSICHAANSAAIMEIPQGHFNMVRAGIAMYGLWPSDQVSREIISLEPVMSVLSRIIHLKDVPSGFGISYGTTHVTSSPTRIATVPIGYADGYSRLLSSKGQMLVRGTRCPVVGRVCMDYTMIDVGHVHDVAVGDDVVVMGKQGDQQITADEIARHINTINYEVVCSFNRRMPLVVNFKI